MNDLYPGQPLEVTVLDTTAAGLVVSITKNLKGLVPKLHMTDSGGAAPKASKFKQNKKLAARCVFVGGWVFGGGGQLAKHHMTGRRGAAAPVKHSHALDVTTVVKLTITLCCCCHRVLSVDPSRKQVTLTLKKGLLGSKLPVLSDLRQAEPGMKLHGVVTGLQPFGVFVGECWPFDTWCM